MSVGVDEGIPVSRHESIPRTAAKRVPSRAKYDIWLCRNTPKHMMTMPKINKIKTGAITAISTAEAAFRSTV
jgi:hypothetical protein